MPRTYEFVIGVAETGMRLDQYLTRHLPVSVSRAMIQRSIRDGKVTVSTRPAKVHQKLRRGDVVAARFDQLGARAVQRDMAPQDIPLEIVHEDAEVLVVNKPAGLVTHPAPGHWDGTLVNAILWHLQKRPETGDQRQETGRPSPVSGLRSQVSRAGIVHRLDKDTSGLLLVGKTEMAHLALARQLKARTIHRRYLALVEGHPPLDAGTIDVPIGRHITHRKVMTVRHLGGRSAVTHYRVLKRFESAECGVRNAEDKTNIPNSTFRIPNYALVEISLDTGRTHQIRVHMAHVGYPVMGDATYSRRPAEFWRALSVTRQLLHAYRLTFQHPTRRREMTVTAPIPADLTRWLDKESLERISDF